MSLISRVPSKIVMLHAKWQRTRFGAKTTRTWNVPRSNLVISQIHKNIVRHTAHTIVSWPNPKQWLVKGHQIYSLSQTCIISLPVHIKSGCLADINQWNTTMLSHILGFVGMFCKNRFLSISTQLFSSIDSLPIEYWRECYCITHAIMMHIHLLNLNRSELIL